MMFGEVNESVKAYGVGGHRHVAEIEQELARLGARRRDEPGRGRRRLPAPPDPDDARHPVGLPRPADPPDRARPSSTTLYAEAYADEPFVTVVATAAGDEARHRQQPRPRPRPPDARTGRILAIGVLDNLVKGAAGQAVQAFNLVHGLPETAGLEQLPLAP